MDILNSVGLKRAQAIIITLDKASSAEKIVQQIRQYNPHLKIYVRAKDKYHGQILEHAGANGMVLETIEASLQLGGLALIGIGYPIEEVNQRLDEFRQHDYQELDEKTE